MFIFFSLYVMEYAANATTINVAKECLTGIIVWRVHTKRVPLNYIMVLTTKRVIQTDYIISRADDNLQLF